MSNITDQLAYLTSFSDLISAYEEIAANRMKKTREKVLFNRDYMYGLNNIYVQLRLSSKRQMEKYKKQVLDKKNDKIIRVFISANSGLYGDLVRRVFDLFIGDWRYDQSDIIIIGAWGKNLFEQMFPKTQFTYMEMSDSTVDEAMIGKITEFVRPYQRVLVYHGLFKNIIRQDVVSTNISGDQLNPEALATDPVKTYFEPSLPKLMDFFEKEITGSLLSQTVFESQLSKFSSRMTALDTASKNIEKENKKMALYYNMEKHHLINKKQQAALGRFFY